MNNLNTLLTKIAEEQSEPKKRKVGLPATAGALALATSAGLGHYRKKKDLPMQQFLMRVPGMVDKDKVKALGKLRGNALMHFGRNVDNYAKGGMAATALGGGILLRKAVKNRRKNRMEDIKRGAVNEYKKAQEKKSSFDQDAYDKRMASLEKDLKRANRKRNVGILMGRGITRISAAHSRNKTLKKIKDLKQGRDQALAMQEKQSSAYSNLRSMAGSLPASMPAGKLPASIAGSASSMLRGPAAKKGKMLKELKKLPK